MKILKSLKSPELKTAQNVYRNKVSVNVSGTGQGWYVDAEDKELMIPFSIDMDIREWGINGIDLNLQGVIEVNYVIYNESNDPMQEIPEEYAVVQVDLSILKKEPTEGQTFTINDLEIYLTEDRQVDYNMSHIKSYYIGDPI
jgi:hypothetical protein